MKTSQKVYRLGIFLLSLAFLSCVKTDDFEVPKTTPGSIAPPENLTTIAAVKGSYIENSIYTFQNSDTYMEGYVISSDEGGNFYKKLVLQDRASNPTAGIQVLIDDASLFNTYNLGRKLYVKLDGLSLWYNNGVLQLGVQNRGDVVNIPQALIDEHIIRTEETQEIEPLKLHITDFKDAYKNLYIQLENIQFNKNLVREDARFTFASQNTDQFDGERQLESCINGAVTRLSTSTFADFKSLLLPTSSGSLEGVLTRNFYDDYYVVVPNSPANLHFDGDARCDPAFLNCSNNAIGGPDLIFEEDFVGVSNENILDGRGWTNVNVNGGNTRFVDAILNSDRFIRISAYNTGQNPLEAWLVTPPINLEDSSDEILSFEIKASFDNATILSVLVSNEFTGNVLTTNWQLLDATIPVGPSSQNGKSFLKSEIDISCLQGTVHVAFRYLGGDPDKSTTYDIDNIRITGKTTNN